jgi:hypothetical protein
LAASFEEALRAADGAEEPALEDIGMPGSASDPAAGGWPPDSAQALNLALGILMPWGERIAGPPAPAPRPVSAAAAPVVGRARPVEFRNHCVEAIESETGTDGTGAALPRSGGAGGCTGDSKCEREGITLLFNVIRAIAVPSFSSPLADRVAVWASGSGCVRWKLPLRTGAEGCGPGTDAEGSRPDDEEEASVVTARGSEAAGAAA